MNNWFISICIHKVVLQVCKRYFSVLCQYYICATSHTGIHKRGKKFYFPYFYSWFIVSRDLIKIFLRSLIFETNLHLTCYSKFQLIIRRPIYMFNSLAERGIFKGKTISMKRFAKVLHSFVYSIQAVSETQSAAYSGDSNPVKKPLTK